MQALQGSALDKMTCKHSSCSPLTVRFSLLQVPSSTGSEKDGAEHAAKPGTTKSPAKRAVESSEDDEVRSADPMHPGQRVEHEAPQQENQPITRRSEPSSIVLCLCQSSSAFSI